jgi:FtsX-like permease family
LTGLAAPIRLVGLQSTFVAANPQAFTPATEDTHADILVKDLAVLHLVKAKLPADDTYTAEPVTPDADARWYGLNTSPTGPKPTTAYLAEGWQLDLGVIIPADVLNNPATFVQIGWVPVVVLQGVIPKAFGAELNIRSGELLSANVDGVSVKVQVAGMAPLIPGTASAEELTASSSGFAASAGRAEIVVVDQTLLARYLAQSGVEGVLANEWWVDVPAGHAQTYLNTLPKDTSALSGEVLGLQLQQAPLRVATQAALWLAILAGALLAAVGFAVHSTTTMRARRLELAQLRAIGLSRNKLVGLFTIESLLLCVLGAVFGIAIGLTLVWLVGPLVAVSPDGSPTVPSVTIEIPWTSIGLLVVELAAVLALVVSIVARVQRSVEPAELLRGGSEP